MMHTKDFGLLCLCLGLITACQAPLIPQTDLHINQQSASQQRNLIKKYYPIEAGRSWTFEMQQTQNGQDNTKFKTMTMHTEALPPENGAQRAILRREYPDTTTVPSPSLVKQFPDRVELSRYKEAVAEAFTPEISPFGQGFIIGMQLPFQAGNAWEGRLFNGGKETISVKGIEAISVPAGNFEALHIEHHLQYNNGKEDFLSYWYAPDVGMVKMYEELTFYYGQWIKFRSTGVLSHYTRP